MTFIEWRDEYNTGIAGVDFEHKELIRQINEVLGLIQDGAEKDRVLDGLGDIYGAISAHFALEEQMMLRHTYERYREHRADHERLLDEIRDIADDYEDSTAFDEPAFQQKLADWFQVHFKTHDSRLHNMPSMRGHEHVSQSALKDLIRDAKNRLLQR